MPLSAILGLTASSVIWIIILATQPYSRWVGIAWMAIGLIMYYIYRRKQGMPLTRPGDEPAKPE